LADVGFGDSFIDPLRLDDPGEQNQRSIGYRIEQQGDVWTMMERRPPADWTVTYQFNLERRQLEDFSGCATGISILPIALHAKTHMLPGNTQRTSESE